MAAVNASWRQIVRSNDISRSSQVISVANDHVSIFGGEIKPRQPVDNKLYRVSLNGAQDKIEATAISSAPSARVGSASTYVNGKTYIFSGRGGEAMAPIEEQGSLHILDNNTGQWTVVSPADAAAPYPPARSYHAMTCDGTSTVFLHAGCPEKGRLSDLWAFNLAQRSWKQLSSAPDPPRGGTSVAFVRGKLYRMNGFDGQHEQGFALDTYDPATDRWTTKAWDAADGPPPRSVSALLPLALDGKDYLVTMFGECDPSNLGHQGAGRMLDDVWLYDVEAQQWSMVTVNGDKPQARGWFAADVIPGQSGKASAIVHGGLAEDNTRLGDVWMLSVTA